MVENLLKHLMIAPNSPCISLLFAFGCFYLLGSLFADKYKGSCEIITHIYFVGAFLAALTKGLIK